MNIGDRVQVVHLDGKSGMTGTVRCTERDGCIAVELDNFFGGHECDGCCGLSSGWYFNVKHLIPYGGTPYEDIII